MEYGVLRFGSGESDDGFIITCEVWPFGDDPGRFPKDLDTGTADMFFIVKGGTKLECLENLAKLAAMMRSEEFMTQLTNFKDDSSFSVN